MKYLKDMVHSRLLIKNGHIITPEKEIKDGVLLIEDGKIKWLGEQKELIRDGEWQELDSKGKLISPGFIDLHIHGGGGAEVTDGLAGLEKIKQHLVRHGTTSFLITLPALSREETLFCLEEGVKSKNLPGANILGFHLEGPYLNPWVARAQRKAALRLPSWSEWQEIEEKFGKEIKIVTLAPEIPGVKELIAHLHGLGIVAAVGHSWASYEDIMEAVRQGLSYATHTFNAMKPFHHREPGLIGAILTCEKIYTEVIVDLVHLHPATINLMLKVKGWDKVILVTDAMRAAGMPEGEYLLTGEKVTVTAGAVRLPNGTLAGSVLTLNRAVANLVNMGFPLNQTLRLATLNPAQVLGISHLKGSLEIGKDADLVIMSPELEVDTTVIAGKVVFSREDLKDQ